MRRLHVDLKHPQPRHIGLAVDALRAGGLALYPTDTGYALGCDLFKRRCIDLIYQLKGLDRKQQLAFLCADMSEVARYGVVDDPAYRTLRRHLPGPFTFILPATRETPKAVQQARRTVGVRIPNSAVAQALLQRLGHPIITSSVGRAADPHAGDEDSDPDALVRRFGRSVDIFLDAGVLAGRPSSVVDLTGPAPVIVRHGAGDVSQI